MPVSPWVAGFKVLRRRGPRQQPSPDSAPSVPVQLHVGWVYRLGDRLLAIDPGMELRHRDLPPAHAARDVLDALDAVPYPVPLGLLLDERAVARPGLLGLRDQAPVELLA